MHRTFTLRAPLQVESLKAVVDANWQSMAEQGKPLVCTVTEYKAKRNVEQNARYWALLSEISEGAWVNGRQFSAEVWAEFFKREYIGLEELPNGQQVGISTTTLSVGAFSDYMLKIEQHAATQLGVELAA